MEEAAELQEGLQAESEYWEVCHIEGTVNTR